MTRRRLFSCTKDDFLPEESFKSWGNYVNALRQTPARLRDRVLSRSMDQAELDAKSRSQHEMKRTLSWWDLIWFGMGAVIGAGIFVLTGREASQDAGPAVVLSYAVSGVSAMLSVFCYTEFAVEIPVAGGSFAYLRVELGEFVAFIAAGNIILDSVIGGAAVARSWTSYLATLFNQHLEKFLIKVDALSDGYNRLDPIAVGVCFAICAVAILSTNASSRINYIASIVHIVIIIFIIVGGLMKSDPANYTPFAPYGPHGVFKAASVLFFAYLGFDAVSTMAEETKNPGRDIPIGLVGSMAITTTIYCVLAITLCLMQPYTSIDPNAPFSLAFKAVGWPWAQYIVAFGALKGMTSVLMVGAVGKARYLTHISRTHMVPPWFSYVDPRTGTPINATIVMTLATAIIAFFTKLDILAEVLSISTLFIFMLVALALLVRRYYVTGVTKLGDRNKLITFLSLILMSSIATASFWGATKSGWVAYCITTPVWLLSTAGLWWFVPRAREPRLWGVPMVPWLPSASIATNIFLLGSIDKNAFVRFGIWTAILLVYYLFFGLHASYDTAKELEKSSEGVKVEDGSSATHVDNAKAGTHDHNGEEIKDHDDLNGEFGRQ
ncbi:unnamed protein product [Cuscuta europaea]|uniref:Cationic amino acid transporter C-terminal domain-containing protein n=1 Tax=Cuscuta europaea TaxID=41803 RepID=A0A9P0ZU34_CUSEU|nr:unnamed protein product [Cuscuta europaea]